MDEAKLGQINRLFSEYASNRQGLLTMAGDVRIIAFDLGRASDNP